MTPRRREALLLGLAGIAAAAHYFSQPGSTNAAGIALFSIYLGIGLLPVVVMVKRALKV